MTDASHTESILPVNSIFSSDRNFRIPMPISANSLEILADNFKTPFLGAISNTTQSLLKYVRSRRRIVPKVFCFGCMNLRVNTYVSLRTLHKIHTFVEAQQKGSKVQRFFRQGEMSTLLKECKAGLQQGLDFFQIENITLMNNITEIQEDAEKRHREVLNMIETSPTQLVQMEHLLYEMHCSLEIKQ
ncbi:hypothetical protein B0H13DRAFT_1899799 [Mycena leptocephala]|nr:hypothetical protein B0H13DRAFT_1899799 [Mycena leptocephala]